MNILKGSCGACAAAAVVIAACFIYYHGQKQEQVNRVIDSRNQQDEPKRVTDESNETRKSSASGTARETRRGGDPKIEPKAPDVKDRSDTASSGAPASDAPDKSSSGAKAKMAASAELFAFKAQMHRRYDPFLKERNLSPEQVERVIGLWFQEKLARDDLQAAIISQGLRGNAEGIDQLRTQLNYPIKRELNDILGVDGIAALSKYERTSAYRLVFVDPVRPLFEAANYPLTDSQIAQLTEIVAANDHPYRARESDLGKQSLIDWESVIAQASAFLNRDQIEVLRLQVTQSHK